MRKDFRFGGSGRARALSPWRCCWQTLMVCRTTMKSRRRRATALLPAAGACKAELVVSDERIDYVKADKLDSFVAFNKPSFDKFKGDINPDTRLFVDSTFVTAEDVSARRPSRSSCSRLRSTLRKTSASCARTSS